jgi:hypothetical protein
LQVRCQKCGQHAQPTRSILDTRTGQIHHMFECRCGGQSWMADADGGRGSLTSHTMLER